MTTDDPGYVVDIISVYRRIEKAEREGRGVRLSAFEVSRIWNGDDAISQAVYSADEMDAERLDHDNG